MTPLARGLQSLALPPLGWLLSRLIQMELKGRYLPLKVTDTRAGMVGSVFHPVCGPEQTGVPDFREN